LKSDFSKEIAEALRGSIFRVWNAWFLSDTVFYK